MAKNKPFTFLDHNLRSGDSLLGANERQLYNGSLEAKSGVVSQMSQIQYSLQYILPTVILKRREIATLPDFDISYVERKEVLLKEADQALEITKLGADMLIGIAFAGSKRRENLQATLGMEYVVLAKAFDEALHEHQSAAGWAAKNAAFLKLRAEVDELLKERRPFHWPLEFPEVFVGKGDEAGFHVIVGNPPFQGGHLIANALSPEYRDYLIGYVANGKRGRADLCAYFFLRATQLTQCNGWIALIATNSIAQGDSREVGLDQITNGGWAISRAIPSRKWPGEANLEVAFIWLMRGRWAGPSFLNDSIVKSITPFLDAIGKIQGNPRQLYANANKSFKGTELLGKGFVLKTENAKNLLAKNSAYKEVLFPYINGEDLNSSVDQSPSRWVINFHEWPLEKAEYYTDCIQIVREKVLPYRNSASKFVRKEWWLHHRTRRELYSTIADMQRVLVRAQVSSTWAWVFVPKGWVYDTKLIILAFDRYTEFALLQNTFHWEWSLQYGTTLRLDLSYTPTTNFETFPFPISTDNLNSIGERYYTHRQAIMLARQEGLTKTYNRFHNPLEQSLDITKLRQLHTEMDEAVAHAYGWDDLRLEHDFHETKQGLRYTISEAARREVLDRLLLLNHARHEEEVKAGLFETKGAKGRKGGKRGAKVVGDGQGMLF